MKMLNFCENMKCELYCAKRWSDACAKAFSFECEFRKQGPSAYDLYSPDEEWLTTCDVDCAGAVGAHSFNVLPIIFWVALMLAFSWNPLH
jgi:hypothetical protein